MTSSSQRYLQLFVVILLVIIPSCKTPNPQTSKNKSANETTKDLKKDVSDVLKKPAGTLLSFLEPVATQFKSLQLLKAHADGALKQADLWAQKEIKQAKEKYKENSLLWETLAKFAGSDGLFNYEDVKNTLGCMGDDDFKSSLDLVLAKEGEKSSGYKYQTIEMLRRSLKDNRTLPNYRQSLNLFALADPKTREDEIQNEINRQVSIGFAEQCGITENATRTAGVFDLIKKHCIQAMEWRSQGILAGLFHLHYDSRSIDKGGACDTRKITFSNFKDLYTQYTLLKVSASQNQTSNSRAKSAAKDFLQIQTSKYFGPFITTAKRIEFDEIRSAPIVNQYLSVSDTAQMTLSGGVPVAAVKSFLDGFAQSNSDNWRLQLGKIRENLKFEFKCNAIKTSFVPTKTQKTELGPLPYYYNKDELRAYFDPDFDGEKYFKDNITDAQELKKILSEMRDNKQNAIFRSHQENGTLKYTHQAMIALDVLGVYSPSITLSRFSTSSKDQKIAFNSMYMEQDVEGAFLVTIQKENSSGKLDLYEYEGYSIPYSAQEVSFETPCLHFTGMK